MTKFINYLNESKLEELNLMLSKIEDKCSHYLTQAKINNFYLYSGRKKEKDLLINKKVRKNRKPKDTPLNLHFLLDDLFKSRTGLKLRSNSIFGTRNYNIARKYGAVYILFPVGNNYQLWFNPEIKDLWSEISWIDKHKCDIESDEIKKYLSKIVNKYKQGFTKNEVEIMLYCDEYLGLNTHWIQNSWLEDRIIEWMKE